MSAKWFCDACEAPLEVCRRSAIQFKGFCKQPDNQDYEFCESCEERFFAMIKSPKASKYVISAIKNGYAVEDFGNDPQLPRPDTVSMSEGVIHLDYDDQNTRAAAYDWLETHAAEGCKP